MTACARARAHTHNSNNKLTVISSAKQMTSFRISFVSRFSCFAFDRTHTRMSGLKMQTKHVPNVNSTRMNSRPSNVKCVDTFFPRSVRLIWIGFSEDEHKCCSSCVAVLRWTSFWLLSIKNEFVRSGNSPIAVKKTVQCAYILCSLSPSAQSCSFVVCERAIDWRDERNK